MRRPLFLAAYVLLFTITDVFGKPFYWTDNSYRTTKMPLLKRAFSKVDHWFKELIDAYPSSTWHWKEHFYGRTFWKDPVLIRGWLSVTDPGPPGMLYRERNTVKGNAVPFGYPGETYPKWNPDFIDDNILSIPDSSELARIEAKMSTKKKKVYGAREVQRGVESESYSFYKDINNRVAEREEMDRKAREEDARAVKEKAEKKKKEQEKKKDRFVQRGVKSESYEHYDIVNGHVIRDKH